ncbi:uncharacterized protein JCM6883_000271 [Sporobolomyces salmoneus]|uniref:uncharacterized protein n=1 Tax=Sporobolomyces salmoneus TaxID=183962 RepID=UPI00316EF448
MSTLPPGWISLKPHLAGVLAVGIAATLSLFSVLGLVGFIALLLWRFWSTGSENERQERRMGNKAIRFLASTHGLLFMDLLLGDLLQAIGFSLNFSWYRHQGLPPSDNPTTLCTTQAVLIQVGDTASAFSSLIISLNLFTVIVLSRQPSVKFLWCVMVLQWIVVAILAGIGPRWLERAGMPFYADAGSWCWISPEYSDARLWLHYFFVFVIAFVDLVLYSLIALYLALQSRRTSSKIPLSISSISGVAKIMPLFGISYIVTILPLSAYRAASMAGHRWSPNAQLAAGFVFTLSGFVNCLIYATTRNIVSSESVGAIRRGSQSATISGLGPIERKSRIRSFFFSNKHHWSTTSKASTAPSMKGHLNSSGGIRVQVETQVYLPNQPSTPSPVSETGAIGSKGRLDFERERIRDWDREREMELDRREREGDQGVDRPFASLREIELEEQSSAARRLSDVTTRKESYEYV